MALQVLHLGLLLLLLAGALAVPGSDGSGTPEEEEGFMAIVEPIGSGEMAGETTTLYRVTRIEGYMPTSNSSTANACGSTEGAMDDPETTLLENIPPEARPPMTQVLLALQTFLLHCSEDVEPNTGPQWNDLLTLFTEHIQQATRFTTMEALIAAVQYRMQQTLPEARIRLALERFQRYFGASTAS